MHHLVLFNLLLTVHWWFWYDKAAVFADGHWSTLVGLVKNRRAVAEYLAAPSIAEELKDVDEKYFLEAKTRKKNMKLAAGEQLEEESQVVAVDDEKEEPEQTLPHMLVGEKPELPIQPGDLKGEKLEKVGYSKTVPNLEFQIPNVPNVKTRDCNAKGVEPYRMILISHPSFPRFLPEAEKMKEKLVQLKKIAQRKVTKLKQNHLESDLTNNQWTFLSNLWNPTC